LRKLCRKPEGLPGKTGVIHPFFIKNRKIVAAIFLVFPPLIFLARLRLLSPETL
jgi:hypothetical protein